MCCKSMIHHAIIKCCCQSHHSCNCSCHEDSPDMLEKHLNRLHEETKSIEARLAEIKKNK